MRKLIAAFAAIACLTLTAATCEQQRVKLVKFDMQKVPQHYRDCVEKVMPLPKGTITRQEAVVLLAKIRTSELRLSACGKAVIRWSDVQFAAYQKIGG